MGAQTETDIRKAVAALGQLARNLPTAVLMPALQDHVHTIERGALEDLRGTGVARGITGQQTLGRKNGSLTGRLKNRAPLRGIYTSVYAEGTFEGKATLLTKAYGLTALIEDGGKTKPHRIEPTSKSAGALKGKAAKIVGARSGVLAISGGAGGLTFAHRVDHPGSQIRAHKVIERTMQSAAPAVLRSVESRALQYAQELGF